MDEYGTSMHKPLMVVIGSLAIALGGVCAGWSAEESGYGVGRLATDEEIRAWNIDVSSTGEGLLSGQGTVKQGAQVFAAKCAMCHGPTGTEGPKDKPVGGRDNLKAPKHVRTVGSHWPYAPTRYDHINRAMPFNAPGPPKSDDARPANAWP